MIFDWTEQDVRISEIQKLLDAGYEIEIDSPDGYVPVKYFIDKGEYQEYILSMDDGTLIRCNEKHLFETPDGWKYAEDLIDEEYSFLTKTGYQKGIVKKTDNMIPIVDIHVDHPNHRYYTETVSSHNTGVGKSLFMCHMASACLSQNLNVLYITLEMAEERIAERIDANLLDISVDDLHKLHKSMYDKKIENLRKTTKGKLIVKEYPTASANVNHFRALLNELNLKRSFVPDIIFVDYLNICSSSRIKSGSNVNSYTFVKAIAEELRGMAVEHKVPVVSATQTTRSGFSNTDVGLEDTSECIYVKEKIQLRNGTTKEIGDVKVGDQIIANDDYKTVQLVHHKKMKKCFRIKTKSGKEIIVSEDHVFPTKDGRMSIKTGLSIGSVLRTI